MPAPQRPQGPAHTVLEDSRPASLWPDSTRPASLSASGFAATRFDPLAEDRARVQT
jgi:hypothetical protein